MDKAELLADLAAKGLRVVNIEQVADAVKEAAGVTSYIANVMEQRGDTITGRNIGFYVLDEGEPAEAAFYRDLPQQKNVARDVMLTYLGGLVPGTYVRTKLESLDEGDRYGFAQAWKDNGDGSATAVRLIVWKDSDNPIAHRELTA